MSWTGEEEAQDATNELKDKQREETAESDKHSHQTHDTPKEDELHSRNLDNDSESIHLDESDRAIAGADGNIDPHAIEATLSAIGVALGEKRVFRSKGTAFALWDSESGLCTVTHAAGSIASTSGFMHGPLLKLYPEEALFLVERGSLVIREHHLAEKIDAAVETHCSNVPSSKDSVSNLKLYACTIGAMSLQECYSAFVGPSQCSIERYQAYAHLKRAGYIVFRHTPPEVPPSPIVDESLPLDSVEAKQVSKESKEDTESNPLIRFLSTVRETKIGRFIEKLLAPMILYIVKRSRRFKWKTKRYYSLSNLRKFILFFLKTAWKWLSLKFGLFTWSWIWGKSKDILKDLKKRAADEASLSGTTRKHSCPQIYPDFEVFLPNSKFKKSARRDPDFYLVVVRGDDAFPNSNSIQDLFLKVQMSQVSNNKTRPEIKVAVVEQGKISFLGLDTNIADPLDEKNAREGRKKRVH
ncbi:tRNA splicing endonuclease 54 [Chytriomyces hyalinus]|nr:tRNA splicing endonuclease 54 [Chytriomyces hyalinus]